jgi:hypothetical protein
MAAVAVGNPAAFLALFNLSFIDIYVALTTGGI